MKVIQFPHPRSEHEYTNAQRNAHKKNWNNHGKHARNFILSEGTYIDANNTPVKDMLTFWGEWEPDAIAHQLPANLLNKDLPHYLIEPVMPTNPPVPGQMNTDPLVFGSCFKYSICRQQQAHNILKNLMPGSLILFGSVDDGDDDDDHYYLLDTVFVVSETRIKYTLTDFKPLAGIREYDKYKRVFLDTFATCCNPNKKVPKKIACSINCDAVKVQRIKGNTNFVYYEGATFDNPVEGMYSFVPAQLYSNNKNGFPKLRIKLEKNDFTGLQNNIKKIPNNQNRNITLVTDSGINDVKAIWEKIKELTEKAGLVPAVQFPYP